MRLPRDISGKDLAKKLGLFGYRITRQQGSHVRLTTQENGEHHITIPNHAAIRLGTLSAILADIAQHLKINRKEIIKKLF